MFATILAAISGITALVGKGFNRYQDRKQAEHEVIIARQEAEKQIAMDRAAKELELGKVQIKATGKVFKYFTFFMWFGPFIISTIFPSYGIMVFENLNQLPEWYVQSCMVLMFAVWGITVSKSAIANIFSGLGAFFRERQRINVNRKMFYDVVRSTAGNITEHEVRVYEKAIDAMVKGDK